MYSKDQQTKKNKASKITQHERDYLEWLQHLYTFCYRCGEANGIEWHHCKENSTDKKVHTELIPLCGIECHRLGKYSVHGNPVWFREHFPIKEQREFARSIYKRFKSEI